MMAQKSVGIARLTTLFAVVALFGAGTAGCSDDTSGEDNDDGGWIDHSGDAADAGPDAEGDDASDGDTGHVDTGHLDTGHVDIGHDADTGPDADTSDAGTDGQITTRGWHRSSFESSMFVADESLLSGDWEQGCALPLWQNAEDAGVERWWVNGIPMSAPLETYPPTATSGQGTLVGLFEATGQLSELGQHGHLGAYDRSFDVSESELDVCGTFEALGHCVVPPAGQWCTQQDVETFELIDTHLTRRIPGVQPDEPTQYYELAISSDKSGEWSELRLSLSVPGHDQSAENGEFPVYTVDELYGASMVEHAEAATTSDTRYENLTGWVALDTVSLRESIYVSISGVDEDGNEAAVWGHFAVDETIAAP